MPVMAEVPFKTASPSRIWIVSGVNPAFLKTFAAGCILSSYQTSPSPINTKCQVGQLNQITTGANAAMFKNTGKTFLLIISIKQVDQIGMHSGIALHQAVQPGYHHSFHQQRGHQITTAAAMAPDQVIL